MSREYMIKNRIYDIDLYYDLVNKGFNKEKLTKEEDEYVKHCYHVEEFKAGLL